MEQQIALVTEKRDGIYSSVHYRLSGPYEDGIVDETKIVEPGVVLPERPHRWEAWVHENFPFNALVDVRLYFPDGLGEYEIKMPYFPERGIMINISTGWDEEDERIRGEYVIDDVNIDNEICHASVRLAGPADETRFMHRAYKVVG